MNFDEARHAAAEALHREVMDGMPGLEGNCTFMANAMVDAFLAKLHQTHVVIPRPQNMNRETAIAYATILQSRALDNPVTAHSERLIAEAMEAARNDFSPQSQP